MTVPYLPRRTRPRADSVSRQGLALRQLSDTTTLITSSVGRTYEVMLPVPAVQQLLDVWADGGPTAESGQAEVLETLVSDGVLSADGEPRVADGSHWARFVPAPKPPLRVITLTGSTLLCDIAEAISSAMPSTRTFRAELTAPTRRGTLLVFLDCLDAEVLAAVHGQCLRDRRPLAPFWLHQGMCWMGPVIYPGRTEGIPDVLGRLRTACDRDDVMQASWHPPAVGTDVRPAVNELYWAIAYFLSQVERWFASAPCDLVGSIAVANALTFTLEHHPVLPMPAGAPARYPQRHPADIADPVTGIVTDVRDIEHHPAVPASLRTVQCDVAKMSRIYPWANNTVCQGSAFHDREAARAAAIGEAAERYCANWADRSRLRRGSAESIARSGDCYLDPEDLILYSAAQYEVPGFPFLPFEPSTVVHWVQGRNLTRDCPTWVPASVVYVNWYTAEYADDPPTNFMYYPGIAAGRSLDSAIVSGLEEIIERDATMIWWMNRQPLPALQLTADLADLWQGRPADLGQIPSVIQLDNEFGIPVAAGVLVNEQDQLLNIGFAARPTAENAARKAWTEALTLQDGSRDMRVPDGRLWTAIADGHFKGDSLKPWRADNAYVTEYRADYRDMNDLMCQQQFYLDPRAQLQASWCLTGASRAVASVPALPDRSLGSIRAAVEARGYEIIYVDVTTADVRSVGLSVVRVIVPGLVPNAPAAFPFLGGRRVQDQAVTLGWRSEPLDESQLNVAPIPHA